MFVFLLMLSISGDAPERRAVLTNELSPIARDLSVPATPVDVTAHVAANGEVTRLSGAHIPETWLSVFKRYEPYEPGEFALDASVERDVVVPTTVTVSGAENPEAAMLLVQAALLHVQDCRLPEEHSRHLEECHAAIGVDGEGQITAVDVKGGSREKAECFASVLKGLRLPQESGAQKLQLSFSLDAGPARVVLQPAAATKQGTLAQGEIKKVIQSARQAVRECHEEGLDRDPKLGGIIHVKFLVEENGHVTSPTVNSSTMNDAGVESCLLSVVGKLVFPQPKGGVVIVDFPFTFKSAM